MEVSTSVLSIKEEESIQKFYDLEVAKTDYFHIDVMDGRFVTNDTSIIMRKYAEYLSQITLTPLDVHLMVKNIKEYVDSYSIFNPNIISFHYEACENKEKVEEYEDLKITFGGEVNKLFIPKDSKLIKTLTQIFNEITNKNEEPIAIGGATFARAFPNCISFGANMPNEKDLCHQADENIKIDNLIISAKIYANAIYKLMEE